MSRKVSNFSDFRQKREKRHFSIFRVGLGRDFHQKWQFWTGPFLVIKSGSFRQVGILGFRLYSKEAWWTVSGWVAAWLWWIAGPVSGGGVPGVWGTGERSIRGATPWYGSGVLSHHCVPTVLTLWPSLGPLWPHWDLSGLTWAPFWPHLASFCLILATFWRNLVEKVQNCTLFWEFSRKKCKIVHFSEIFL